MKIAGCSALVCAVAVLLGCSADAREFQIGGRWSCSVNARSDDPANNYAIHADIEVLPGNKLMARGELFLSFAADPIQRFEGAGEWSILPPEEGDHRRLIKFRARSGERGFVTWFALPVDDYRLYNMFSGTGPDGIQIAVETQCGRPR